MSKPEGPSAGDMAGLLARFNPLFSHNWSINRPQQTALAQGWRDRLVAGKPLPSFREAGFRAFSQCDEDGVLLLLFTLLGAESRKAVEICCGDGVECNVANLVVNHGWSALMVDGDKNQLADARFFYDNCRDTVHWPPKLRHGWVTAENINGFFEQDGFVGEIDLFSLDVDGVDYWLWKALEAASPRVVVAEYNDILGPDVAVTVPYDPLFRASWRDHTVVHGGASLGALVKLGREKGCRLVGSNNLNFNAFFLRDDLGQDLFPEVSVESCFQHPRAMANRARHHEEAMTFEWRDV